MGPAESSISDPSTADGSSSRRARDAVDRFVSLWEEMASTWGINRTMAKVHALLYCAEEPLNTDQIMDRLDVSRGNANMNLRSLVDWNLVRKTERTGSRKDYYEAEKDVWQITARIIEERQRREVHPVRSRLEECAEVLVDDDETIAERPEAEQVLHRRFANLIDLVQVLEGVSEALLPLVRNKNVDQIEQLLDGAVHLKDADSNQADSSH
jgi:DNA-binding transcriptional regulator GbsR (MarR family)